MVMILDGVTDDDSRIYKLYALGFMVNFIELPSSQFSYTFFSVSYILLISHIMSCRSLLLLYILIAIIIIINIIKLIALWLCAFALFDTRGHSSSFRRCRLLLLLMHIPFTAILEMINLLLLSFMSLA